MRIQRQIDIFDKRLDKLVEEVHVDYFDLEVFKERFSLKHDDPSMHRPYEITSQTADLFPNINFDFEKFLYYITSYQV